MFFRTLPLLLFASCVSIGPAIPKEWMSVPQARGIPTVGLDAEGKVTQGSARTTGPIRVENNRIFNGEKALTDPFAAIDSFDYSASRGEVVFSVKRDDDFDIGLVSSDGSPISWVPNDPADEIDVQWAPRGNKISYTVRLKGGDIVRTVHIPTAFELSNAFPNGTIHALAWDPQAERYAVAYSTPDASDRVEVMKYDGKERRMAVEPEVRLDVDVEPFAKEAIVLRPREIRYDEKLPVVVWVAESFAWNDARAALMKSSRVAMIVTTRSPDADLWKAVGETSWMDASRAFVVERGAGVPPDPVGHPARRRVQSAPGETPVAGGRDARPPVTIVADPRVPEGRYRRGGGVLRVAPRVVQSFAAGFIADQLKRTAPPNASSR